MALFNYATKEITLKIVYYGPGLSGKTTNLQHLHTILNPETKGKLLSLATESDRTLFFDFLPIKLGKIRDFSIRFQLYTVPGQVRYNSTRKIVLKGADGVVFVADSQNEMSEQNIESFMNMRDNLSSNNINPDEIPVVLQYNKRDLKNISTIEELSRDLNTRNYPVIESSAVKGIGVEESFNLITRLILKSISKKHQIEIKSSEKDEQAKPEVKSEVRPEFNPKAKPALNVELTPGIKADRKPEIKAEVKLDSNLEVKPDLRPNSESHLEAERKPDSDLEVRLDLKPDSESQLTTEVKPNSDLEARPSPHPYPVLESPVEERIELHEEEMDETAESFSEDPTERPFDYPFEKSAEPIMESAQEEIMKPAIEIPVGEHHESTTASLWPSETEVQPDSRLSLKEPEFPVDRGMEQVVLKEIREVPVIPAEILNLLISELKGIHLICRDLKKSVSAFDPEMKGLKELKKEQERTNALLRDILGALSEKKKRKRGFRLW